MTSQEAAKPGPAAMHDDRDAGLTRYKDNQRRYGRVFGGLAIGGGVTGGVVGFMLAINDFSPTGTHMQVVAVIAVIAFILTVSIGSWKYFVTVDELEVDANKWAGLVGINFYAMLWICWWALGTVQLTPAPNGNAVFLLTMAVAVITFLWRRFR